MADAAPAPTYLGMVMCDNIIQDQETRQYYLLGTATVTYARNFPAHCPRMCIYIALTGIREPCTVEVRLVHVDSEHKEDRDVMSISGAVDASDPLAVAELTMRLRNLVFPKPGEYRFQLLTGGTFLGERRFVVKSLK
jgi:hypothetical protein